MSPATDAGFRHLEGSISETREMIWSSESAAGTAAAICWIGCAAWPRPIAPCIANIVVRMMMAPSREHPQ